MQITVLVDNQSENGFAPEFGLSLLIRHNGRTVLFDTGAGIALPENLKIAQIAPESLTEVILSHGHSDHTGALAHLAPQKIYCSPFAAEGHFSLHSDGSVHDICMPETVREMLKNSSVCHVNDFISIGDGLFLSGTVPRISGEDCGGKFFHDPGCTLCDTVKDEIFLLSSTGVLISGCCHSGIINSLRYARDRHPEIQIHTIVGGLHLRHAGFQRLKETAEFLKTSKVKNLYLMHCTGEEAAATLKNLLPDCNIYTPAAGAEIFC